MSSPQRAELPARAAQTTAEHPWPVSLLSAKIEDYVAKMSPVWVEGQVVQLSRRPGNAFAYLTLRDTTVDASLSVTILDRVLAAGPPVHEGDQVVVWAKPRFWTKRGSLNMEAKEIRPVGVGQLLAQIEQLKQRLAAEGLFAAERKSALPFLPGTIGLICGRESKAEHDVVVNAQARWPGVRFEIREVAVQGANAVAEVSAALRELDADPAVEVIVIARGGGAVEDLLPFSNEALVRAAAAARTPLVSAIGHETDNPLLDLVADYRASTPTDAAKRIVPDAAAERALIAQCRTRALASVRAVIEHNQAGLDAARSRPVLANPQRIIENAATQTAELTGRAHRALELVATRHSARIDQLTATLRALSPAATLDRGYAIIARADGAIVRSSSQVATGDVIVARLASGRLTAKVAATAPDRKARASASPAE